MTYRYFVSSALRMHRIRGRGWLVFTLALASSLAFANAPAQLGETTHVQGGPWMLAGRVFRSAHLSDHPHLVIVLHGDAPHGPPKYQYVFAERAAVAIDDVVVVALMRPGYSDPDGLKSEGAMGWKLGDNYTRDRIDSIAAAATTLMQQYRAADLTLVGHSGGAAISADILALHPDLARRAMLVSCPCDLPAFRRNMLKVQWNPLWLLPESSISPQENVGTIPRDNAVVMVVGAEDPFAPARETIEFAEALKAKDGNVTAIVLPTLGHEILLEPQVMSQLKDLLKGTAPASSQEHK